MTEEHKRKMMEEKKRKSICGKCGKVGHYAKECTTPEDQRAEWSNIFTKMATDYNMAKQIAQMNSGMTVAQAYKFCPDIRKQFHRDLRNSPSFNNQ
jgi:Zinc knuckle